MAVRVQWVSASPFGIAHRPGKTGIAIWRDGCGVGWAGPGVAGGGADGVGFSGITTPNREGARHSQQIDHQGNQPRPEPDVHLVYGLPVLLVRCPGQAQVASAWGRWSPRAHRPSRPVSRGSGRDQFPRPQNQESTRPRPGTPREQRRQRSGQRDNSDRDAGHNRTDTALQAARAAFVPDPGPPADLSPVGHPGQDQQATTSWPSWPYRSPQPRIPHRRRR
jgi:hypothetical protein